MICYGQTNKVLCRKCDEIYHCRGCFNKHQITNSCGIIQVEKLLGKDKSL